MSPIAGFLKRDAARWAEYKKRIEKLKSGMEKFSVLTELSATTPVSPLVMAEICDQIIAEHRREPAFSFKSFLDYWASET